MNLLVRCTLYALLIARIVSCSNLFIRNAGLHAKLRTFSDLRRKVLNVENADRAIDPDSGIDSTLSLIIMEAPLATTQSALTAVVYASAVAQWLSAVAHQHVNSICRQSLLVIVCAKLIDVVHQIDISSFSERDDLFDTDLSDRARDEMRALAYSRASTSVVYALLCLTASSPTQTCLLPFVISELPNVLRYMCILRDAVAHRGANYVHDGVMTRILFPPSANDTTNLTAVSSVDDVCEKASSVAEVYVASRLLFSLFQFRGGKAVVAGATDVLLLIVKALLLQNFLSVRIRALLSENAGVGMISMLRQLPLGQTLRQMVQRTRGLAAGTIGTQLGRMLTTKTTKTTKTQAGRRATPKEGAALKRRVLKRPLQAAEEAPRKGGETPPSARPQRVRRTKSERRDDPVTNGS
jgi:hypothetical protein